eukprot:11833285-Ditylum_brightwellii.AAC.1
MAMTMEIQRQQSTFQCSRLIKFPHSLPLCKSWNSCRLWSRRCAEKLLDKGSAPILVLYVFSFHLQWSSHCHHSFYQNMKKAEFCEMAGRLQRQQQQ